MSAAIRMAEPADVPVIADLIRGLARFEKLEDEVTLTEELLAGNLLPKTAARRLASRCSFTTSRPFSPNPGSISKTSSSFPSKGGAASGARCSSGWRRSPWSASVGAWNGRCSTGTATRSVFTSDWERSRTASGRSTGSPARPSPRLAENRSRVEVLRPKEIPTHPGDSLVRWARRQLEIARDILDNPGGGLLFATQTIGQVRAALTERDAERWEAVVALLGRAEDAAVRREFDTARQLLDEAAAKLS